MLKFRYLTYSNFGLVEKWYEDMAKKGWQIEKIPLPFVHKFKKAKQENVNYKISLVQNEGYFSSFTKDELDDFDQMSKDYGWTLIDRCFNMNLYRLEKDAAESLYNDDLEELKVLNKGIKGELISILLSGFALLLNLFFMSASFHSPEIFYSNLIIFLYPGSILLLIFALLSILDNISFRNKNKYAESIGDIKFSKIAYSKIYAITSIISFVLLIVGIVSNILSSSMANKNGLILVSLMPLLLPIIIFVSIKKIKKTDFKTKSKKQLMVLSVVIITIIFTFISINSLSITGQDFEDNTSDIVHLKKSLLTKSHTIYKDEQLDLQVEKIVTKNRDLARTLFKRELKNAKNHPYNSDLVKDISGDYSYDMTYSLANENSYIILDNQTVLKVIGDIKNPEIQIALEKELGDWIWQGTNIRHLQSQCFSFFCP